MNRSLRAGAQRTLADEAPPSEFRSALMAKVRGKDTKPEKLVRSIVHSLGFRFRLHQKDLPGRPDLVLKRYRWAIFVHGCFWHRHKRCSKCTTPKTRVRFWQDKFEANVTRDKRVAVALKRAGWLVTVVWECETRNPEKLAKRLSYINRRKQLAEQGGSNVQ
jgi:DNA mismatch endonuclease (patch repair protein)